MATAITPISSIAAWLEVVLTAQDLKCFILIKTAKPCPSNSQCWSRHVCALYVHWICSHQISIDMDSVGLTAHPIIRHNKGWTKNFLSKRTTGSRKRTVFITCTLKKPRKSGETATEPVVRLPQLETLLPFSMWCLAIQSNYGWQDILSGQFQIFATSHQKFLLLIQGFWPGYGQAIV